jgi:hypothetical protein
LPCCGFGHRVGDVPVPRRSSTGAVTIAADRAGASVRPDPEFAKKEIGDSGRRRSGGRCGSVCITPLRLARAKRPTEQVNAAPCRAAVWAIVSATSPYLAAARPAEFAKNGRNNADH